MTPARIDGPGGIVAPAVLDPGWMPGDDASPWPELAEMREVHARLLAATHSAAGEVRDAQQALEALARNRHDALKDSYVNDSDADLPALGREELEHELAAAHERAAAATTALVEHVNGCVERIADRRAAWLADLDGIEDEHREALAEAQRALAEAEARVGVTSRLRHWIDRTGGIAASLPGEHIQFSALPTPAPETGGERDDWMRDRMRQGLPGTPTNEPPRPVTPEEKEAMVDRMLADIDRQEAREVAMGVRNA